LIYLTDFYQPHHTPSQPHNAADIAGAASTVRPSPSTAPAAKQSIAEPKAMSGPAPTPGPLKGYGIAVGNTLPGLPADELARRLDDFKALGIAWIRLDFDWNDLQPSNAASFSWSQHDKVVAAANARGLRLLPILTYTAPWARLPACGSNPRCAPADPAQYANFARETARHYAPLGIHHWEIWNEENSQGAWEPAANAADYVQFLKAAYTSIKQIDASATVISGGLASSSNADGIPQLDYLRAMYAAGAKPYFDAIGYHPYSYPVPASYNITWNAWSQMGFTAISLRSIMAASGDDAKQIWVTEYGAPTGGPSTEASSQDYHLNDSPDHVTEEFQAQIAADVIRSAHNAPWIGPLFWYGYRDEGTSTDSNENFFGLIRADGSPKPAYEALKQAIAGNQ